MYAIDFKTLTTNALIEKIEKTGERIVSFPEIEKHKNKIKEELGEQEVNFFYEYSSVEDLINNFPKYFSIIYTGNGYKVKANDNISLQTLKKIYKIN